MPDNVYTVSVINIYAFNDINSIMIQHLYFT